MNTIAKFEIDGWRCRIIEDNGVIWYTYRNEEECIGFKFSLLCEVGQRFIPYFRAALRSNGYTLTGKTRAITGYPFLTDSLRKLTVNSLSQK